MVNVTKTNFIKESNDLLNHLPSASFIAIDEEMTGISIPGITSRRPRKDQSPTQRYEELKKVPERYSIIQLGVSLFHDVSSTNNSSGQRQQQQQQQRWKVRKYNFYMFPNNNNGSENNNRNNYDPPNVVREIVLNPGAVAFLNKHNMSFDLWTKQGINYLSCDDAADCIQDYIFKEKQVLRNEEEEIANAAASSMQQPSVSDTLRRKVELRRSDDIDFYARAMASLREWLDSAVTTTTNTNHRNLPILRVDVGTTGGRRGGRSQRTAGTTTASATSSGSSSTNEFNLNNSNSFLMPPCNSFLRRALYENIEKEYPNLILEKSDQNPNQIRVLRLNETEKQLRRELLRRKAWENTIMKVGMYRVVDALRRVCNGLDINRTTALFATDATQVNLDSTLQGIFFNDDDNDNDDGGVNDEEEVGEVGGDPTTSSSTGQQQPQQRKRKIPIVVHNGFMDLLFLMTHFHSQELPDKLVECKQLISSYFPVVYDTKVMATECCALYQNNNNNDHFHKTNLSALYDTVVRENRPLHRSFETVVGNYNADDDEEEDGELRDDDANNNNNNNDGQEHEAAYDAYMTGCVFVGLSILIHHGGRQHFIGGVDNGFPHLLANSNGNSNDDIIIRSTYGRNKLYQLSMFTLDLEEVEVEGDPLSHGMSMNSSFRVSGIDPSISTRDIVRCMNDLIDGNGRRVNFDIVWVDDTTFIVAARFSSSEVVNAAAAAAATATTAMAAGGGGVASMLGRGGGVNGTTVLRDHGILVENALRNRFQREEIISLEEYFYNERLQQMAAIDAAARQQHNNKEESPSWISRLLEMVGIKKRKADDEDIMNHPAPKRRRQS